MDAHFYEIEELPEREVFLLIFSIFIIRQLKIMINGDSSTFVKIKLSKNANFKEIAQNIEDKLDWKGLKKIRLFSPQGVEIFQDDLDFLKSGTTLYVSRGKFIIFQFSLRLLM